MLVIPLLFLLVAGVFSDSSLDLTVSVTSRYIKLFYVNDQSLTPFPNSSISIIC